MKNNVALDVVDVANCIKMSFRIFFFIKENIKKIEIVIERFMLLGKISHELEISSALRK